jgi:hypothetical protein
MPTPGLLWSAHAAPAAGGGWSPADITGIVEYWDMSDTGSITQSGTVTQVDGQLAVYNLVPQGGGGTGGVSGTRDINGLNVVDFDQAVPQGLKATVSNIAQPFTLLIVYQADLISTDNRWFDSTSRALYDSSYVADASKRLLYAAGGLVMGSVGGTNAEQVVAVFNGASSQAWVNGVSDITGNPGSAGTGTTVHFGSFTTDTTSADGRLAFAGLVSGAISAGDRSDWDDWCARWGL